MEADFVSKLQKYERQGIKIVPALYTMMLDPEAGWYNRGNAARLLAVVDGASTINTLLELFFEQSNETDLYETALTIEHYGNPAAVPRLVGALYDSNVHRRRAAARALGWIWPVSRQAAKALVQAVSDKEQPEPVREEAAESLAYSHYKKAIEPLSLVLAEPDVRMRLWAVFALGSIGQSLRQTSDNKSGGADVRIVEALEDMLRDHEVPSGNWWSVGREALAMLSYLVPRYEELLNYETR